MLTGIAAADAVDTVATFVDAQFIDKGGEEVVDISEGGVFAMLLGRPVISQLVTTAKLK